VDTGTKTLKLGIRRYCNVDSVPDWWQGMGKRCLCIGNWHFSACLTMQTYTVYRGACANQTNWCRAHIFCDLLPYKIKSVWAREQHTGQVRSEKGIYGGILTRSHRLGRKACSIRAKLYGLDRAPVIRGCAAKTILNFEFRTQRSLVGTTGTD